MDAATLAAATAAAKKAATAAARKQQVSYLRGQLATNLNAVAVGANAGAASNTYRKVYTMGAGGGTDLRLYYDNWYVPGSGGGETAQGGQVTIKASVEYSGVSYPAYFPTGSRSVVLDSGARIESLPIATEIPAGATFYVRTYAAMATNTTVGGLNLVTGSGDGITFGSDVTDNTGGLNNTSDNAALVTPTAITCTPLTVTATRQILVWGDSRSVGQGDPVHNRGMWRIALTSLQMPLHIGRGGEKAQAAAPLVGHARRASYLASCDYMVEQYDINDITAGRTLAQIQADLLTLWNAGVARGLKVYTCTGSPYTNSTDGWLTTANQTKALVAGQETIRTSLNDWRRAGAPIVSGAAVAVGTPGAVTMGQAGHPLTGYFEIADKVESARNSGLWKATGRTVTGLSVTAASTTLTSSGGFQSTDTAVYLPGAGAAGAALLTAATYVDANTMTLGVAAGTTVSAVSGSVGPAPYTGDGLHPGCSVTNLSSSVGTTAAASGINPAVFA